MDVVVSSINLTKHTSHSIVFDYDSFGVVVYTVYIRDLGKFILTMFSLVLGSSRFQSMIEMSENMLLALKIGKK